ncbi:MAG: hypothetical protein F9K23_03465 [Bacteroidetes bacterium]|nr:MAG: hypothetical protein F9K23_03465 [Bacteroidota bacterium]
MKYNIYYWPFDWFGLWKEHDEGFENYPSVHEFVDRSINSKYNKTSILSYLKSGEVMMCTSAFQFPNPITGKRASKTVCYRTDGKRIWFDDIIELIENNDLCLPNSWLQEMMENNYRFRDLTDLDIDAMTSKLFNDLKSFKSDKG